MLNPKVIGFFLLFVFVFILLTGGISLLKSNNNYPPDIKTRIEGKNSVRYKEMRKSIVNIFISLPFGVVGFILLKKRD